MAIHSTSRKATPPTQTAITATGARIAADMILNLRLDQSKRLAGGEDVIDLGSAKTPFAGLIFRQGGAERL